MGWNLNDLTVTTGAPTAAAQPTIGYAFIAQHTQHVNFPDVLGNVQELWWDSPSGWHLNNLTAAAGAPKTSANPTGYVFDAQGTQHVNYVGVDSHVYELWWDTAGWHYNDLTAATGAPLAEANRTRLGTCSPPKVPAIFATTISR